jgi:hypothetical protein
MCIYAALTLTRERRAAPSAYLYGANISCVSYAFLYLVCADAPVMGIVDAEPFFF